MDAKIKSAEEEIRGIAARHGITFTRTAVDDHCDTITRLAGDDVAMDDVQNLIIAIRRADVHDGKALTLLHFRYLEERGDRREPKKTTSIMDIDPSMIETVMGVELDRRKREGFERGLPWPVRENGITRWEWPDGTFTDQRDAKDQPHSSAAE